MKLLIAGIATAALFMPATGAFAQGAAENAYGGSGQVPAVLGVSEAGGGETGAPGGAPNGVAGVQAEGTPGAGVAGVQAQGAPGAGAGAGPVATAATPGTVPSGSLPFTGLDLALIALGGIALLAVGLVMRRVGRPLPHA